jgi:hypothetical protein
MALTEFTSLLVKNLWELYGVDFSYLSWAYVVTVAGNKLVKVDLARRMSAAWVFSICSSFTNKLTKVYSSDDSTV